MPGVMDIENLLCDPCDPYSSSSLLKRQNNNAFIRIVAPTKTYYEEYPLQQVDFWKHDGISNSTQSINNYHFHFDHHYSSASSPSSSSSSSPSSSPILNDQRRRVNSEICRRSISASSSSSNYSDNSGFIMSHSISINRRKRSNSTSYIQTRTPWTPEEDGLLQKGYEQGLSWAMISCTYLPHRSRGCCWGRFKTLQSKNVIEVYQQRICQRPWKISNSTKLHTTQHKKKASNAFALDQH